jgi:hypothetical protein
LGRWHSVFLGAPPHHLPPAGIGFQQERLAQHRAQDRGLAQLAQPGPLCFVFDGRDVTYLTVQAAVVVPVDPLGGAQLDVGQGAPGPAALDQLGLVQADRRLHQGVVQRVAYRADRGGDVFPGQVGCQTETRILRPRVGVMDQPLAVVADAVALPQAHLQAGEHERGRLRRRGRPADDAAGEGVHDERDVHRARARARGHVREVSHPAAVRR